MLQNLWAHFCTFIVQYTKPMHLFRNILEQFLTSPVICFFFLHILYAAKTSNQRWFITNGINFSQLRSRPGSVLWVIGQIASKDEISPIQDGVWVPPYCWNPVSGNGTGPLNYSSCDSRLSKQTQLMNAVVYFFHSVTLHVSTLLSRKVIFLGTNLPNALYRGISPTF